MFSLCLSWDIHFLLPSEISGPGFGAFTFWPGLYTSLHHSQAFEFGLNYVHHLEKEMATHSSTLAWKISWTEEPGRLQSMGSQRVGHDWVTYVYHWLSWFSSLQMVDLETSVINFFLCCSLCVCVYIYIYIYIYPLGSVSLENSK